METYLREGFCNYIICHDVSEGNELNMLSDNKIPGVLPRELRYIDGKPKLYYHIEGRQEIALLYERKQLNHDALKQLLSDTCGLFDQVGEYFLDSDNVVLDEKHIYWNWERQVYEYIYLPGYQESIVSQLMTLVEFLLKHVDYQDVNAANLIYRLYEKLRNKGASIELFRQFSAEDAEEGEVYVTAGTVHSVSEEARLTEMQQEQSEASLYVPEPAWKKCVKRLRQGAEKRMLKRQVRTGAEKSTGNKKGENLWQPPADQAKERLSRLSAGKERVQWSQSDVDMIVEESPPTMLLANEHPALMLKSENDTYEDIILVEGKTVIGRQEEMCDYIIPERNISRMHASISLKEGQLSLTDLNSSNGTFVNGEKIPIHEPIMLSENDKVGFASVRFLVV